MAALKAKQAEVADRKRALQSALRPQRNEGSVTQMLKDAAGVIHSRRGDDPWLVRAYLAEWRLASGGAPARIWPGDIRPHEKVPLIGQGQSIRISTGTTESYGSSLAAAVMATSEAFSLWSKHAGSSM